MYQRCSKSWPPRNRGGLISVSRQLRVRRLFPSWRRKGPTLMRLNVRSDTIGWEREEGTLLEYTFRLINSSYIACTRDLDLSSSSHYRGSTCTLSSFLSLLPSPHSSSSFSSSSLEQRNRNVTTLRPSKARLATRDNWIYHEYPVDRGRGHVRKVAWIETTSVGRFWRIVELRIAKVWIYF